MSLSPELIRKFAKITNNKPSTKQASIVFGTIPVKRRSTGTYHVYCPVDDNSTAYDALDIEMQGYNWQCFQDTRVQFPTDEGGGGSTVMPVASDDIIFNDGVIREEYFIAQETPVHIDGSYDLERPLLTTVFSTVAVHEMDRVMITIQNHRAVITSNVSDPSTSVTYVEKTVSKLQTDVVSADYVQTASLEATEANINKLTAEQIQALNVIIERKLDAATAEITYAKIDQVDANYGEFSLLKSDYSTFKETTTDELYAEVAEIEKLIFGSAGGNVIQTSFANAVIAQLGQAQIKSAMIDSIDTNEVTIRSKDGRLIIADDTIQISDSSRVRVQIGKDASNDYSINVWDAEGKLMFSKGGITDAAIKNAIIRDDMIASNANISAGKIFVSDANKTLDIAFKDMSGEVTSQGSEITALKNSITTKVWQQDIDKVRVGGRNLLPDTDFDGESKRHECTDGHITEGGFRFTPTVQVESEVEYTLSAYIRGNANIVFYELNEGGNIHHQWIKRDDISETEYQYYTITFTVPSTRVFNTVYICTQYGETATLVGDWFEIAPRSLKLERGNKSTDWTPAPEDAEGEIATLSTKYTLLEQDVDSITTTVASHTAQLTENSEELTVVQSTIGQLADSISMLVTDGNGTSLMTQTEDGWTFSTSDIQAAVDRTSEALADLVAQCGNTDAAVEVLQQSVSDLGVMAEYIRIGTHEGEPCIELGEGDSNFKLLITNTRIMFMDGSDIPAYISNKALHIKKAVIEEELHQGGYAWVTRSNGHLSLIWKGATN